MTETRRRPGGVTAAATLGFVAGGLLIFLHLWTVLALLAYSGGGVAPADAGWFTAMYAVLACRIGTGVLYVWGGLAALRGRTGAVLLIAAVLHLIFAALVFVTGGAHGYGVASTVLVLLDLVVAVPIVVLISLPSNKGFFTAA